MAHEKNSWKMTPIGGLAEKIRCGPPNKKYKWCNSFNNGNGTWGFLWKNGHDEWENKQGKRASVSFINPANNSIIYCSYPMTTR